MIEAHLPHARRDPSYRGDADIRRAPHERLQPVHRLRRSPSLSKTAVARLSSSLMAVSVWSKTVVQLARERRRSSARARGDAGGQLPGSRPAISDRSAVAPSAWTIPSGCDVDRGADVPDSLPRASSAAIHGEHPTVSPVSTSQPVLDGKRLHGAGAPAKSSRQRARSLW